MSCQREHRYLSLTPMSTTAKLSIAVAVIAGLLFPFEARAEGDPANPTITITNEGANYVNTPAQLDAKVGQAITIKNNDPKGVHSVTAKDRTFSVDVPPNGSATLTVKKAGSYPYYCQYHIETHNPASITVS